MKLLSGVELKTLNFTLRGFYLRNPFKWYTFQCVKQG